MLSPVRTWTGFCVTLLVLLTIGCGRSVQQVAPVATGDPGDAAAAAADRAHPGALLRLHFVGSIVSLAPDFLPREERKADFFVYAGVPEVTAAIVDTVPANAVLKDIRWLQVPGGGNENHAEYRDDGPGLEQRRLRRPGDGLPFTPGTHSFIFDVPERLGGGYLDVFVQVDFAPEEVWWPGPDPALFPRSSDGDGRAVDVLSWTSFTTRPAWPPDGRRAFGPDSFAVVPSQRRPVHDDLDRRTFYEIFGDRIYAHSEGDTVHFGAWVAFELGGFDRDSRYVPIVSAAAPTLPPGFSSRPDLYAVLIAQGLIGSPTGFRIQVRTRLPGGATTQPSESTTFPNFDVASVFYQPNVAGYWRVEYPGKAYAIASPVDAEGSVGRTTADLVALADRVDAGGGTPADRLLRRRVLTFFVRGSTPVASD